MKNFTRQIVDAFNVFNNTKTVGENEKPVDVLKRILADNGFKPTQVAANIFFAEIGDLLPTDVNAYWQLVATQL